MGIYLGDKEVTMAYLGDLPITSTITLNPSEGSILYLDATNPLSYPGTGNTWYDLSGFGNNATLYGSISESFQSPGYFEFSGSADDYAEVISGIALNLFGSQIDYTAIVISQYDGIITGSNDEYGLVAKSSKLSNPGFALGVGWNNGDPGSQPPIPAGVTFVASYDAQYPSGSQWMASTPEIFGSDFVVTTVLRSSLIANNNIMYINKGQGPNFVSTGSYANSENVIIGKWGYGQDYFKGKIAVVALYNRALTTTEIGNLVDYYDTILPIL